LGRKIGMPYLDLPSVFWNLCRKEPKPLACFWMFLVEG